MRLTCFYLLLLLALPIQAEQNQSSTSSAMQQQPTYQYSGVITSQSSGGSKLYIDYVEYAVDYDTAVYQTMPNVGESGPKFDIGSVAGFSIDSSVEPARITAIWILD